MGMDNPVTPKNKHIYLLPNLLTTCGMFAGFYAILAAANGQFNGTVSKQATYQEVYKSKYVRILKSSVTKLLQDAVIRK